ncbi:lipocalin family protein [Flavobacterium enshiense]|uniref:lipocalin family protein n=1 Tax=Flavobacterium enshiense TaxID=1341165 RepID=UPI00345CF054
MKKVLLLVSFLAIGFTSCNKDDDSSDAAPANIEGKWAYTKSGAIVNGQEVLANYEHECTTKKDYLELLTGGVANDVYYPSDCVADAIAGTWSRTGNVLTRTIDGVTTNEEVYVLNATTLKVKYTVEGMTLVDEYTRQ